MKIDQIVMKNFCGYKGNYTVDFPKTGIMLGANGTGKTTVLNAIRYALTGDKPDGDIINKDASQASVTITLTNENGEHLTVTRVENRDKANACYLGNKKLTQKSLATWIEDFLKLPLDKVKIISSAEVLSALSDADFGKFLLSYIGKKTPLADVISWLDSPTDGAKEILNNNLPAEVGIENLDELDFYLRDSRKSLKKEITSLKALVESLPDAPENGITKDSINAELETLKKADTEYQVYLAKLSGYEKMVSIVENQKAKSEELKKQIALIKATEPDESVKDAIQNEFEFCKTSYDNNRTAYNSQVQGKTALEKELAALSNPGVCPLSPHVRCHEDMSVARQEISDAITAMTDGINALVAECNKAAARMKELREQAQKWQDNANSWAQKENLEAQLKAVTTDAALPEKPVEVKKPDTLTREQELNAQLKLIDDAAKKVQLSADLSAKEKELADTETLIKAVSDKGVIRKNIVTAFLSVFEDECNKKCEGTSFAFRFSFDKGVVPEMRNSHGVFLRADELSGGEKAFFYYVIISLLNSLTGTRLLLLDELSVMDTNVFNGFLSLIKSHEADFDTVVLSAVDHPDTVKAAADNGFDNIEVKQGLFDPAEAEEKSISDTDDDDTPDFMKIPDDADITEEF